MALFRIALTIFAIALIVFGVITSISPAPFGFVFVILGVLLLAAVAPAFLCFLRMRSRWLDRQLDRLQKKLPRWIAGRLEKSDVDHNEDEGGRTNDRKKRRRSHR